MTRRPEVARGFLIIACRAAQDRTTVVVGDLRAPLAGHKMRSNQSGPGHLHIGSGYFPRDHNRRRSFSFARLRVRSSSSVLALIPSLVSCIFLRTCTQ
jgi:hypothetical protein